MTKTLLRAGALTCALLTTTCLTAPAMGQSTPPPLFDQVDANGVDLFTGGYFFSMTEGSIGSGNGALSLVRNWAGGAGWTDNWSGVLYTSGATDVIIEFGNYSDRFTYASGTYSSVKADGATLTAITTPYQGFLYTAADGTQITFRNKGSTGAYWIEGPACQRSSSGRCALPITIRQPNGMTYALSWDLVNICTGGFTWGVCNSGVAYPRFRGTSNSANYSFTISYATNTPGGGAPVSNWYVRTGAQFTNLASAPSPLPAVVYSAVSSTVTDVTDIGGQIWRLTNGSAGRLTGIRRPGAGSDSTTISYDVNGAVSAVTRDGVTTGYSRYISGSGGSMTVTDADSHQAIYSINLTKARITSVFDVLEHSTVYSYDSNSRLTLVTLPEGNSISYSYDARGNLTQTRAVAKSGSGLPAIVTSASYDTTCSNIVTCNQPNSITDARGNVTNFTYDATHGGVLTATAPAPSGSGDRPQTRYAYSAVTAVTGQPVYLPTSVSACASGTSPTCVGTASEARTVIAYDTANLRVTSVTQRNGDNSISAPNAFTYDAVGNLQTVDGPLSGSADTTRYRYDSARRTIGVAGPDPDGAGSLTHQATRTTYTNGLPTKVETGTVSSQSDADWTAFTASQRVEQDYDGNARPTVSRLMSGSTTHSLTQTSYDSLGRVQCVAQRMNPAEFATTSLPSDACTLDTPGTGSNAFGPDRIARTVYDAAGRPSSTGTALGTADETWSYVLRTDNGQVSYLVDVANGANNTTAFQYDGHDRPIATYYPNASGGGVNWSDYEAVGYDAAGNVTGRRTRAGETLGYSYDNLNRLLVKVVPERTGLDPSSTRDVYYGYDLGNRPLYARFDSPTGQGVSYAYDGLGRQVASALVMDGVTRQLNYQYDAAGNRTRITYPDGRWFRTLYDQAGQPYYLDDDAAAGLAYAQFLPSGPMSALQRVGAASGFAYDALQRPVSRAHYFAGTTGNGGWSYGYTPAGQLGTIVREDAYAYTGHANGSISSSADGQNRVTAAGGVTLQYDANGNLTSDGTSTFIYDVENRLVGRSGGVGLRYDPLGRLYEVTGASGTTRFLHDGAALVAEYDASGAMLRRHVHWPGVDTPVTTYEGATLATVRQLFADHQGSIVAVADGAGTNLAINRYDEYGVPASTNTGRFGYTGQVWLPELGLYYYRARIYNPALGRFMQTDPIGYGAGLNLYAYVGNDPVNFTDPSGLRRVCGLDVSSENGGTTTRSCWWIEDNLSLSPSLFASFDVAMDFFGLDGDFGARTMCQQGLAASAAADQNGVARAEQSWNDIASASLSNSIDARVLAALGLRESNFEAVRERGGGAGVGVFQLTNRPGVTTAQAMNIRFSANYAAGMLRINMAGFSRSFPHFSMNKLYQAALSAYNQGPRRITGNPDTIDLGTEPDNRYGQNVLEMASCFGN